MAPPTINAVDDGTRGQEADNGKTWKSQRKRDWEKNSKQKAKKLKLNSAIEWGVYNPNFTTSGKAGELEVHGFLQRLEQVSTFAQTRRDTTARLLAKLRNDTKLDILAQLKSELLNIPEDDVILLDGAQSLKNALEQPFNIPLFHQSTADQPNLGSWADFSMQDFLKHLAEHEGASICVYDYSIENSSQRTRQSTVHELVSRFRSDVRGIALNFLDIENRTNITFRPYQIALNDITTKLNAQTQHHKGKILSEWKAEPQKEFFLASLRNAVSTIHVDTGGANTWILMISGRKIWYFPRKVTSQTVRWLGQAGSQRPEHYEGGWVKIELRPGDLLVMPPSFPHAVFSPEDCLVVGGQFYTTATLAQTVEGLKLQADYPGISNEDLYDSMYSTVARFLRECGPITTLVEKAKIISSCSLFPDPTTLRAYEKLSKDEIKDMLRASGAIFSARANKQELLEALKRNRLVESGTQEDLSSREQFLEAAKWFSEEFLEQICNSES